MTPRLLDDPHLATLVGLALDEDEVARDVTSRALVPASAQARAQLVARRPGVIAGLPLLAETSPLRARFPAVTIAILADEGARVAAGAHLATLEGPARDVLALERTLLNFLQRLSGIATLTASFVAAAGDRVRIQETRKTCPGWRHLDKYAVAVGGGLNHRASLGDQVLIKENHLVFAGGRRDPDAVRRGVAAARAAVPAGMVVEVEVEDLDQLDAALEAGADVIMLDDFDDAAVAHAVARRGAAGSGTLLEVSGSVDLTRIARLAATGIDRISVGALTHSVPALDLALEIEVA